MLPAATSNGRNEIYFMHFPVLKTDLFCAAARPVHDRRYWDKEEEEQAAAWASVETKMERVGGYERPGLLHWQTLVRR